MKQLNLSPLQLELLKIYAMNHSEEDLLEIKKMLGQYFAKKLRKTGLARLLAIVKIENLPIDRAIFRDR